MRSAHAAALIAIATLAVAPPPADAARAEPREPRIVIHAVGDVNFASSHNPIFLREGYEIAWTGLFGIFTRDDLTIVNLECSPTEIGTPLEKPWRFRCPLAALAPMRAAGVDVTGMANNHAGDMGMTALQDARANLIGAGFRPVGAGADLEEANQPVFIDLKGRTVAIVAASSISGGGGWFATDRSAGVAPLTEENIAAVVSAAGERAEIVIATVHWGGEGATGPTSAERRLAQVMIGAGVDAIVGHHPHVLQTLEYIDGVPVFWSMGNFVWSRHYITIRNTTAVAEIVIEPDGSVTGRLIPVEIVSAGHPVIIHRADRMRPPMRFDPE